MKSRKALPLALCIALSACSDDDPTLPRDDGTNISGLERQLLNSGTATAPTGIWRCVNLGLGFYGSGQGLVGIFDGNSIELSSMSYSTNGNAEVGLNFNDGTAARLAAIQFGGNDSFSANFIGNQTNPTNCNRLGLRARAKANIGEDPVYVNWPDNETIWSDQ